MLRAQTYIAFLLLTALTACTQIEEQPARIVSCADMPAPCASAIAFSFDGKGYVFGGRNADKTYSNLLWKYDPNIDQWQNMGETPLKPRVHAMAQVVGEHVYIGMGFNGHVYNDDSYLRDFWRYTPATGEWKRLNDFPTTYTVRPVTYAMEDKVFVLYACGPEFSHDVYAYDIRSNTWEAISNEGKRAYAAHGVVGTTCQGRQFIGGGFNSKNLDQWFEVNLTDMRWTKHHSIPTGARTMATCTANSCYIYVMGGRYWGGMLTAGHLYADILRFSPKTEDWAICGTMPYGETENLISFTIGERIYFGLGEDIYENIHCQLYCIE